MARERTQELKVMWLIPSIYHNNASMPCFLIWLKWSPTGFFKQVYTIIEFCRLELELWSWSKDTLTEILLNNSLVICCSASCEDVKIITCRWWWLLLLLLRRRLSGDAKLSKLSDYISTPLLVGGWSYRACDIRSEINELADPSRFDLSRRRRRRCGRWFVGGRGRRLVKVGVTDTTSTGRWLTARLYKKRKITPHLLLVQLIEQTQGMAGCYIDHLEQKNLAKLVYPSDNTSIL